MKCDMPPDLRLHELEQFSYAVAHDFRPPLRAIGTILASLREGGVEHSLDLAQGLEAIRRNQVAIEAMIDNLLYLVQAAENPLGPVVMDMEALVREAWAEIPSGKGVALKAAKLPQARGDRSMLKLVWKILLLNAVRYTAGQSSPRIEATGSETDGHAVYGVRDNGVGFDIGFSGKLFYVYEQVQEMHPGTGIGLAIVQRIVTRHRGDVWVEARPDQGAFFQFSLPLNDPAARPVP